MRCRIHLLCYVEDLLSFFNIIFYFFIFFICDPSAFDELISLIFIVFNSENQQCF